jgi:hypothetical protein
MLQVTTYDGSISDTKMFSTISEINYMTMNELGVPLMKYSSSDSNSDGKNDEINFHI